MRLLLIFNTNSFENILDIKMEKKTSALVMAVGAEAPGSGTTLPSRNRFEGIHSAPKSQGRQSSRGSGLTSWQDPILRAAQDPPFAVGRVPTLPQPSGCPAQTPGCQVPLPGITDRAVGPAQPWAQPMFDYVLHWLF